MKRRKGLLARVGRALLIGIAAWMAITVTAVVAMRWIDPPTTAFMFQDQVAALVTREQGYEFRHEWREYDQISRTMPLTVVAADDQQFPLHHGFDFKQIDKALKDRERGRRVRGASTVSQQVAKNLFLWPGQSWFRKGMNERLPTWMSVA